MIGCVDSFFHYVNNNFIFVRKFIKTDNILRINIQINGNQLFG